MKRVWKCDFCSSTDVLSEKIKEHELNCHFNPLKRFCYTCKFHGDEGYYGDSCPYCEIKLDHISGEEDGNCKGWQTDNPRLLRKIKLQKLEK